MERKSEILLFRWIKPSHHVVLVVSFTILAIILGYVISVTSEHVNAIFPYISDTGTKPPASCVFGLMLNLASVFAFTTMFIRHRYFEKYNNVDTHRVHAVNDLCLFIGSLSAFGIMLVANFQESNQLTMHLIGAILAFALGLLYCAIQCYLTYVTVPFGFSSKFQFCLRCCVVAVAAVAFVSTFTATAFAVNDNKGNGTTHEKIKLQWSSSDPGYAAHLVSTFSEWIMVFSFISFFLTFYKDFKRLRTAVLLEHMEFPTEARIIVSTPNNMFETD